jgi:hypothetical protein
MAAEMAAGPRRKGSRRPGVLYRLWRNLADFLAPKSALPEAPPPPPAVSQAPQHGKKSSFEDQLRQMLGQAGSKGLAAGRVMFIGLDKVKRHLGAAWERVAADADRIARHAIARHLEPGDIYAGLQGLAYVMVFARPSREQARLKCLAIADEIARRLVGEAGAELLEVKTAVARLDGSIALETIALADALTSVFADAAPPQAAARAVSAPPAPPRAARRPDVKRTDRDLLEHVDFAYRPIWDKARDGIASGYCTAQVTLVDVAAAKADVATMIGSDHARVELDQMVQQRVLSDLDDLVRGGRPLPLVMPVHFQTLAHAASRHDFIHGFGERLSDATRKLLLLEIEGVPERVAKSQLAEIMLPLRGHCRGLMLRMPLETSDFRNLAGCGAFAIGTDLGAYADAEPALREWMNHFARGVEQAGMRSCALGLASPGQVAAAIGAGFAYAAGDAVAKPIDRPGGTVEFCLDDVHRSVPRG